MEKELIEALDIIYKTNIGSIMLRFIIVVTLIMSLKTVAEAVTGHVQFILDKHIAIGSLIEVYGKQGRVKSASLFTLTVETDCGFIRIPFKDFRSSKYLLLKDKLKKNRRKEDGK